HLSGRNFVYQFAVPVDFIPGQLKFIGCRRKVAHIHHREVDYDQGKLSRIDPEGERHGCYLIANENLPRTFPEDATNATNFKVEGFKGAGIDFASKNCDPR